MFVGSYAGDTIFYRNIASAGATNPVYSYDANNPFGITNVVSVQGPSTTEHRMTTTDP
jgi:hypothetical protein